LSTHSFGLVVYLCFVGFSANLFGFDRLNINAEFGGK
jgi:hypothetical protein